MLVLGKNLNIKNYSDLFELEYERFETLENGRNYYYQQNFSFGSKIIYKSKGNNRIARINHIFKNNFNLIVDIDDQMWNIIFRFSGNHLDITYNEYKINKLDLMIKTQRVSSRFFVDIGDIKFDLLDYFDVDSYEYEMVGRDYAG